MGHPKTLAQIDKTTASKQALLADVTVLAPLIKSPPKPTLSERLLSISHELSELEAQCEPGNRGYLFAIRRTIENVASIEERQSDS